MRTSILVVLLMLARAVSAVAQAPVESKVGKFTADLSIPEAPAFTVLGVTPQTVVRPSSPQQFATSLLNGVDRHGNFQSGFAVDTQPYMLFYGHRVTWNAYERSYLTRFFSRAQVSLASTKGATDSDRSARAAGGLRFTVFDLGDPYRDQQTADCLAAAQGRVLVSTVLGPVPGPLATPAERAAYDQKKLEAMAPEEERCRAQQADRVVRERWNNSSLIVAWAGSGIAQNGNARGLRPNGQGVWASLGYGFEGVPGLENASQLIVHYKGRGREMVAVPGKAGSFVEQDSDLVGVQWRLGTGTANGSFEYVFVRTQSGPGPRDSSSRWSLALERRVSGNIWLQVSTGSDHGRADGGNAGFLLSSLNWSLNRHTN